MATRKQPLTGELELAITDDEFDAELAATDDQPADDAWLDDDAEPATEPQPSQVDVSQLAESSETQPVGDALPEAASIDRQSEPKATEPPPPDPVAELLSGTDDELIAAIQQAQAEADAAAAGFLPARLSIHRAEVSPIRSAGQ
jgi:hypothetical protein